MQIITRTPFRISLLGGGTDYPGWFMEHGGAVLGFTIDKYCYVFNRANPETYDYLSKVVYSKLETVQDNKDISHPLVNKYLESERYPYGVEIHYWADMPAMKGMGTSSAFAVGLVASFHPEYLEKCRLYTLAGTAIYLERFLAKQSGGYQDQQLCTHGGCNFIEFSGDRGIMCEGLDGGVSVEHIPFFPIRELPGWLLLCDTGLHRRASDIASSYSLKNEVLERMVKLAYVGKSVLLDGDYQALGEMLNEAWYLKKSLSPRISNPTIDDIYEKGLKVGAIGGKLLGAGAGGYMLFLAKPDKHDTIKKALEGLRCFPVGLSSEGVKVIYRD